MATKKQKTKSSLKDQENKKREKKRKKGFQRI